MNEQKVKDMQKDKLQEKKENSEKSPVEISKGKGTTLKTFLLDAGLIVTLISFSSYVITFAFHVGFCLGYKISISYINLNFTNILSTSSYVGLSLGISFVIFIGLNEWCKNLSGRARLFIYILRSNIGFAFTGLFFCVFLIGKNIQDLNVYILIGSFTLWILTSFLAFLEKNSTSKKHISDESLKLGYSFSRLISIVSVFFILTVLLSALTGNVYSRFKETFDIIKYKEDYIILSQYDDKFICTKIINDSSKAYDKLYIIDYSTISSQQLPIEKQFIGQINYTGIP